MFTRPTRKDPEAVQAAFEKLIDDLNRFHPPAWMYPVFEDDTAAQAGNLKVGYPYVTPDGTIRRRMA